MFPKWAWSGSREQFLHRGENFATANRRYSGDVHYSSVVGLFMTPIGQRKRLSRVMVECICLLQLQLNLQLDNIDLVRTCRTSSFCTGAWHLARFQLKRRIARSLCDSSASCPHLFARFMLPCTSRLADSIRTQSAVFLLFARQLALRFHSLLHLTFLVTLN